jgi:cytoskeletal protein RodZ
MSEEQQKPEQKPDAGADKTKASSGSTVPKKGDAAAKATTTEKKKPPKKRSRRHAWALLLVLLVLAGMVGVIYYYAIQHPHSFNLKTLTELTSPPATDHPATETPAPAPSTAPQTDQSQEAAPVVTPQPSTPAAQPQLSSEDAKQLMTAMTELQQQLQQMRTDNAELRQALTQQQRVDLRSRLKLIADPDTRLKQLSLLWEDVSLSPALTAQQRSTAISMTAAAHEAMTQNQLWQQRLDKWITKLSAPESGPDLIPHFDHPWLEWLAEQFHLRPAPANSSSGSQVLRERLMQIRRGMTIETWPDTKDWQPIRAELILIHASAAKTDAEKAAGIGLPNDFKAMRKAVATLHETGRQWLEAKP